MHGKLSLRLILFVLLACPWSSSAVQAGYQPPLDSDLRAMFSDALAAATSESRVPGAVMAVKDSTGNVAYFTQGQANLETGQAMDPSLYFRIGSVTKTFTATAILQLVDEQTVELKDTLEKWLPGKVAGGGEITVGNLLEMRSGLDHYDNKDALQEIVETDPQRNFTVEELLAYGNRQVNPPGQTFDYNNLNYLLLQLIIEKATGQDYPQAIHDRLIAPQGLTHTSVPYNNDMPSPYAHGYHKSLSRDASGTESYVLEDSSTRYSISIFGGAGDIISTADDVLTWLDCLVEGKALSQAMHQAQWDAKAMGGSFTNMFYGLGVGVLDGAYGHNGNFNGIYTTAMYRYRGYDIVVLANGQTLLSDDNSTAQNIFNSVRTRLDAYLKAGE